MTPAELREDVMALLDRYEPASWIIQVDQAVAMVTQYAKAYTRGVGFDPGTGEPGDDIAAVIVSATARLAVNPSQLQREKAGEYEAWGGFKGWNLVELAVLDRYRQRAA